MKNREPGYPTFQPPPDAHALGDLRTRWALRQRFVHVVRRRRWLLGPYAAILVLLVVSGNTVGGPLFGIAATLASLASLICVPLLLATVFALLRTVHIWWLLARHPWRAYQCPTIQIGEGGVGSVTLTVQERRSPDRYFLTFQADRRRETLRGMIQPAVWIAGDPGRRGALVMAGGGELFLAHRQRSAYWALASVKRRELQRRTRPAKPPRPVRPSKPIKPQSPAQRARAEAKRAKETARAKQRQAKAAARLAKLRASGKTAAPAGARRSLFGRRKQNIFGPGGTMGGGSGGPFKRR